MTRMLTIGGPRPGEWVTVDDMNAITMPAPRSEPSPEVLEFESNPKRLEFDYAVYNVKSMILFNRKIWVLLYSQEKDPDGAVIRALFNDTGLSLWAAGERRPE